MDDIRASLKAEIAAEVPHPRRFREALLNKLKDLKIALFRNIRSLSTDDWDNFDTDTSQLNSDKNDNNAHFPLKKKPRKIHNPWTYHYTIGNYSSCANYEKFLSNVIVKKPNGEELTVREHVHELSRNLSNAIIKSREVGYVFHQWTMAYFK